MITSQLESSGDRFLSLCLQDAVDDGWLNASDLSNEFPPSVLMSGLEGSTELRAKLLVEAAGVHERIAPKKSTSAAAEDLQIALDEGICTPEIILSLVPIDAMVQHLDPGALWGLLTRDQFWTQNNDRARARMLRMLECAMEQKLLDLSGLINAVTPERLAKDLPRDLLELIVTTAIQSGLEGSSLSPAALRDTVALESWLEHIDLAHFWDTTISGEVAGRVGVSGGTSASPKPKFNTSPADGGSPDNKKKKKGPKSIPASSEAEANAAPSSSAPPSRSDSEAEKQARTRAIATLTKLDRLPTSAPDLRTPVLLGLESMYADLLKAATDEDRQEILEDAFPNPAMLKDALLAMAVTLDPRLTKDELLSRGADNDALVQLVLFEERRLSNRIAGISPSAPPAPAASPATAAAAAAPNGGPSVGGPPPPLGGAKRGTAVPPLPQGPRRISAPPPPLPKR